MPNDISIGAAVLAQLTAESSCTLQQAAPFSLLKLPLLVEGLNPHLIPWFIGPT